MTTPPTAMTAKHTATPADVGPDQTPRPQAAGPVPRHYPTPELIRVVTGRPVNGDGGTPLVAGASEHHKTVAASDRLARQALEAVLDDDPMQALSALLVLAERSPSDQCVHACLVRLLNRLIAP